VRSRGFKAVNELPTHLRRQRPEFKLSPTLSKSTPMYAHGERPHPLTDAVAFAFLRFLSARRSQEHHRLRFLGTSLPTGIFSEACRCGHSAAEFRRCPVDTSGRLGACGCSSRMSEELYPQHKAQANIDFSYERLRSLARFCPEGHWLPVRLNPLASRVACIQGLLTRDVANMPRPSAWGMRASHSILDFPPLTPSRT
jgi:hypothetical protein